MSDSESMCLSGCQWCFFSNVPPHGLHSTFTFALERVFVESHYDHHDHHHHHLLHCSSFECPASNNTPCLLTIAANWARSAPDRWRKLASQASSFPLSFAYKSTTKMWLGPNKGNGPQPFPLLLKDCTAWLLDVTWQISQAFPPWWLFRLLQ